jgi:antitoxin MazE
MQAVLKKWGNSVGVRLPVSVLKEVRLTESQRVEISVKKGAIVLKPQKHRRYTLAELMSGVTTKNRHALVDLGKPVGRELL